MTIHCQGFTLTIECILALKPGCCGRGGVNMKLKELSQENLEASRCIESIFYEHIISVQRQCGF
ncbi:hypothetical protein D3C73_467030 [compost metagenome]